MWEFKDDSIDDGSIIHYDLDNGVTMLGATEGDTFIAAMVDSTISSNNKLPKEWCNLLGCRFGTFREKCRRALSEKDFEIILDEDAEIIVVSPTKKYRIHLALDVDTSKFVALLITLNECPHCKSNNFALRKMNAEMHISYCSDCNEYYLPFLIDESEDKEEDIEVPSCPNCGSDDVDDDGSDFLQYTCNDCGHNWGHDDTVVCPECGSDNVENDGTDNLQYKCNICGHMWGNDEDEENEEYDNDVEEEYDEDTDNAGNKMSEYIESLGVIINKSTKSDVERMGGVLLDSNYGKYKMPNGTYLYFFGKSTVNHFEFHRDNVDSMPQLYKNIGLHWGMGKSEFKTIFERLGFSVNIAEDRIAANKKCKKYDTTIVIVLHFSCSTMHCIAIDGF